MFSVLCALLWPLLVLEASNDVTFKNVEFKAYSVFALKFTKKILSSNSLKNELPFGIYDHLEFTQQHIPILRENSISDIEDLDELTIENCEVKEIQPKAFKNLPSLRKLSLKGNRVEKIKAGIFNGLELSMLDLGQNKIKLIEANALSRMPNLLNINLADNLIEEWNRRWFEEVPLLTRISMQNNSLTSIPAKAFTNLNGEKKFGSVKLTINLIFSHNKISRIEDHAFDRLGNINNLWLDNNKLTEFAGNLLEKVDIQDLRIDHNQIRCLNDDLGKIIKANTTHMDGNPLECPCVDEIQKWAKEHDKNVDLFYSNIGCLADRLKKKMDDLNERLKKISNPKEVEEVTPKTRTTDDEVEVLF